MSGQDTSAANKAGRRAAIAITCFVLFALAIWVFEIGDLYSWFKIFHLIAVISWMAGMVYLPRLFVYHADAEAGSDKSETFKLMERRLLKIIMTPAMITAWVFGLALAFQLGAFSDFWFWIKLLVVVAMTACHGFYAKSVKSFSANQNQYSSKQWRMLNEIPTVLMIIAVAVVILKPGI